MMDDLLLLTLDSVLTVSTCRSTLHKLVHLLQYNAGEPMDPNRHGRKRFDGNEVVESAREFPMVTELN